MSRIPWYLFMDIGLWMVSLCAIGWGWWKINAEWRLCACCTAVVVMVLQCVNEYVSVGIYHAWSFSFQHNRMIGIFLFGQPLEEYLFWWAFAWLIPFLYLCLNRRVETSGR